MKNFKSVDNIDNSHKVILLSCFVKCFLNRSLAV